MTVLSGRSGSGKSTLFKLLAGLDRPTSGVIEIEGTDITRLDDGELADLRLCKLGLVFQSSNLLPTLTAFENVRLPMDFLGVRSSEAGQRTRDLLDVVGVTHRADARPNLLSGGEQQRVAIARALANRPALVIADEPTASLDRKTADVILDLLVEVNASLGTTILLISHDEVAHRRAARHMHIDDGKITAVFEPAVQIDSI